MMYKGFMVRVHFEKYGMSYSVNGVRSIVKIYPEYVDAIINAKSDIDSGYWNDLRSSL